VLVLARENRNKGNMTPYEYLGGKENSERWRQFEAFVTTTNKAYRQAKRNRLLKKDFGDKEAEAFRERNLNDTRYICRFFKNYVERYLHLAEDSKSRRCVVVSGSLTSLLRARWGLPTSKEKREESDRHHAMDAAVVAACGHQIVKRLSTLIRADGWTHKPELGGYLNVETGELVTTQEFVRRDEVYKLFPRPWPHFRNELEARLKIDDSTLLCAEIGKLGTYSTQALDALRPLFVSRAPQRRNSGAAHKETVYTKPRDGHVLMVEDKQANKEARKTAPDSDKTIVRRATAEEKIVMAVERIGVMDKDSKGNYRLSSEKLDYVVDPYRNERMVEALRQWIAGREEREKAAKAIESSFGRGKDKRTPTDAESAELELLRSLPRKPLKSDPDNGPFTGPIIRAVKVSAGKTTGIPVRKGIATNDTMLRVDLYQKSGKYFLIPVYVHHSVATELPNHAIVAHKDEEDWTVINDGFDFRFSMYPNDLIRITQNQGVFTGYYAGCDRGSGNVNLWAHDRNQKIGKDGLIRGIGVKTALTVEKFNVDMLGNIYPAPSETRRGMA
jgi:CRISPR-associated endonuclease Csn1